jgi:hypothetical protein
MGGTKCQHHDPKAEQRLYRLTDASDRQRLASLSDHSDIKSLREEIALLRLLIEERRNIARTDADKISAFSAISSAMLSVEKLVKSCHQMEQNLGSLLGKSTIIEIAGRIAKIISEELYGVEGYEEIIDRVELRMLDVIKDANNEGA